MNSRKVTIRFRKNSKIANPPDVSGRKSTGDGHNVPMETAPTVPIYLDSQVCEGPDGAWPMVSPTGCVEDDSSP
jgi:hypothetical protein